MPRNDEDQPASLRGKSWSQHELDLLHEMVREYENAKWFRGKAKWWALWFLGVPAAVLAFWEPIEKLWRLIKGH